MTKNVSVETSTQVGREIKDDEEKKEEEYTWEDHKMSFYLDEDPYYEFEAIAEWQENSKGEMIGYANTQFVNISTRQRCGSVREALAGWSEQNKEANEKWETLCQKIEALENIDELILEACEVGL